MAATSSAPTTRFIRPSQPEGAQGSRSHFGPLGRRRLVSIAGPSFVARLHHTAHLGLPSRRGLSRKRHFSRRKFTTAPSRDRSDPPSRRLPLPRAPVAFLRARR